MQVLKRMQISGKGNEDGVGQAVEHWVELMAGARFWVLALSQLPERSDALTCALATLLLSKDSLWDSLSQSTRLYRHTTRFAHSPSPTNSSFYNY